MKAILIVLLVTVNLSITRGALGQASFELINRNFFAGVDAPVFDAEGMPLEGMNYLAELWGAPTPDSLAPLRDLGAPGDPRVIVPFETRGYFFSGVAFLSVPNILPPGGFAWLQLRAWDARLGATYEEVFALGIGGYGESPLFYANGNSPVREPPEPPAPLIGLESFSLRAVIPEPSPALLLLLGLPLLLLRRRRTR